MQKQIIDKKLKFYVIDAISLAEELGLVVAMIVVSMITRGKTAEQLKGLIWSGQDTLTLGKGLLQRYNAENGDKISINRKLHFWKDYRLVGLLAMTLMIVLIWVLR